MSLCIRLPNFVQIGPSSAKIWCYIDFQDGGPCGAILLPVSDWVTSLFLRCQFLSANQISNNSVRGWRWDITITQLYFTKKLVAHNNLKKKRKEKQQYKQDDNHLVTNVGSLQSLFLLSENKRLPYWNSTSGFDFDHIAAVDMSFCISLRNFIQIGLPTA